MSKEEKVVNIFDIPRMKMFFQTELTDRHWDEFEAAFLGVDLSKPKPARYFDIKKFDKDEFNYKLAALIYWLVFDSESVPPEIKKVIEEKGAELLVSDLTVKEKMQTLESCMAESIEAASIYSGSKEGKRMVLP